MRTNLSAKSSRSGRSFVPPTATVRVNGPLLRVIGHDTSLRQCLANLLDNAVKFVPPGVTPYVELFAEPRSDHVRICVRDNGIGIDQQSQRQLFATFQRLPNAQAYQGTGVGLAIARKSVERMHGSIGLESTPGKGSTFWVELPKAP
ncbi:MAG: sensor histidine kinase [Opitutaceae bacterium]